ncbi:MAG: response regulator transcription factor, partial [Clostridia bacterium]|nr:response regulator transcription factor [Clostridia bacterium]
MGKKILIVEDESTIADIIAFNLVREGFETQTAYDGGEGLRMALKDAPDLILLDVMLPVKDGFEVCKQVRTQSDVPIIMLTAREEESDKVTGLELGADDYVTKPFSMRELIARVRANMRRTAPAQPAAAGNLRVLTGALSMSEDKSEIYKNGKPLDLSVREFDILTFLASAPDKVFSREELM